MDLNIFQETNPVSGSNVLVGAIYKNSAPTTLVDSFIYPGPYTGQTQTHTFPSILNVAYRYVCWESPDGTASGTVRNDFVVQPSNNAYQTRDDVYLTAGIDPNINAGGQSYTPDPSLIGWKWRLERGLIGPLKYTRDYVKTINDGSTIVDTTEDDTNANGWRLTNDTFINNNEDFIIHFEPQIAVLNTPTQATILTAIQFITTNTTLDASAKGKSNILQGSSAFFTVTLPNANLFADGDVLYFASAGGIHVNVMLQSQNGNNIIGSKSIVDFTSGSRIGRIVLAQNETITLVKCTDTGSNACWYVLQTDGGWTKVGEQLLGYAQEINTLPLDGREISRSTYLRLWDWVNTLPSTMLIVRDGSSGWSKIQNLGVNNQPYYVNRGLFHQGDGLTTFGLPDLTNYGFQRTVTAANAGLFRPNRIPSHKHTMHGEGTIAGSGGPYYLSRSNGNGYSGAGSNIFGGRPFGSGPDTTMKTGSDNADTTGTQYENEPNSYGIIPLIRI